ncbi:MAG: hypothetical protein K1X75_10465 [Leptospirales bacterium]|nr:hypothetical protein [Leptospirales bacterium]
MRCLRRAGVVARAARICAALCMALASRESLRTAPLPPGYARVAELLPALWNARYPLAARAFLPNPEARGILTASDGGRRVYYYHFQAVIPRPVRQTDEVVGYEGERRIELWVRFRPWLADAYDLSFARRDLLPGANKRWILR